MNRFAVCGTTGDPSEKATYGWTDIRLSGSELLFAGSSLLYVAAWFLLLRWYSLQGHASVPDFAFDKIPGHFDSATIRHTLLLFLELSVVYVIGYLLIHQAARISSVTKVLIVGSAVGAAVANVLLYPVGALDVFNYLTNLKLTYFYHQNPYVTTFASYSGDPFAKFSLFTNVPLVYGPAWLLFSRLPLALVGFGGVVSGLVALKVFNAVLLGLTAWGIYHYREDDGSGWLSVYVFALNPLVIFEGVGNAHNDVMMTVFLIAAMVAMNRERILAAPALALSVLVKFLTAALIPVFGLIMIRDRWPRRTLIGSILLSIACAVIVSLPYWDGGKMLTGISNGVSANQALRSASVLSLVREYLQQAGAPDAAGNVAQATIEAVFALLLLLILVAVWRHYRLERAVAATYLLFTVLLSVLFPWYLLPALAVLSLSNRRSDLSFVFAASALGILYYPISTWAWFNSGMSEFHLHLFLSLFLTWPILIYLGFLAYEYVSENAAAPLPSTDPGIPDATQT